jgi:hypothetical protein
MMGILTTITRFSLTDTILKGDHLRIILAKFGTFCLKIEQFRPFEEISIFSNGGHLGYRIALTDTIDRLCKLEKRGDEIKKILLL